MKALEAVERDTPAAVAISCSVTAVTRPTPLRRMHQTIRPLAVKDSAAVHVHWLARQSGRRTNEFSPLYSGRDKPDSAATREIPRSIRALLGAQEDVRIVFLRRQSSVTLAALAGAIQQLVCSGSPVQRQGHALADQGSFRHPRRRPIARAEKCRRMDGRATRATGLKDVDADCCQSHAI